MAITDAGTELTELHRQQVLQVRAATLREIAELWPLWAVQDSGSFDPFVRVAATVTVAGHNAAAQVASSYWNSFRIAEVGEATAATMPEPLNRERLTGWLRQSGLGSTVRALRAGKTMEQARQVGLVEMSGASGQMVMQGSQDTVLGSVETDPVAQGWARTTTAKPCAFCAMLAARGPVYRSRSSAGFDAHPHCACGVEPVFDRSSYRWPDTSSQFRRIYDEAVADARNAGELYRGTSNDLFNAFRRRYSTVGGEQSIYSQNATRKAAARAAAQDIP